MTTTEINLETILPWSEPKRVATRAGDRMLRKSPATEAFWALWRANKETLKAAGISCSPIDTARTKWEILWWQSLDPVEEQRQQTDRAAAVERSRAQDSDLEFPRPEGLDYLGYQKAGIAFALECFAHRHGCLIGDEMGLGKTIQAIGVINATPEINKVLIVCPNTLKLNWQKELRRWLTRPLKVAVQYADRPYLGDHVNILIVNYDVLHKFVERAQATKFDLRVTDESHYVKNPKARRTKATLAIDAPRKIALSGTPIENRPVELWPVISDLHPARWHPKKGFFGFAKRFCGAVRNSFGWDFSGASNLPELQNLLRGTVMVRRLKADVLTELPAKRRQVIELEADGLEDLLQRERDAFEDKQEMIDRLRARCEIAKASDSRAEYDEAVTALRAGQGAAFEEMALIRHETALAKLPQCLEFIRGALDGGKCIVFAHHVDVVAKIKAEFPQASVVTGAVKAGPLRQAEVDRFMLDPSCDVFIGNNAAAEGLTLTASAHVIFVELDWVPGKLAQKEDRAHRIGQKDSVLCSYLVLEGSLDSHMAKVNVEKMKIIDSALDKETGFVEEDIEDAPVPVSKVALAPGIEKEQAASQRREQKIASMTPKQRASFDQLEKDSERMTDKACALALEGMKRLAACDNDHAAEINDIGFSKLDVAIGHDFAGRFILTRKQGALAARLCNKYRCQLGEQFIERLEAAKR
jgi:SNF2 family DNA or RNA helicase